jgi:hypothetical protein
MQVKASARMAASNPKRVRTAICRFLLAPMLEIIVRFGRKPVRSLEVAAVKNDGVPPRLATASQT